MMNPAPVFDRVHAAIRDRIASGVWRPGQRIELAMLCDLLDASPSPVRDALHRLRGERLVMDGESDGFCMPSLTEAELADLYAWAHQLLMIGLRGPGPIGQTGTSTAPVAAITALFEAIMEAARNAEARAAMRSINARLGPARLAELSVLDGIDAEIAGVRQALLADDRAVLRTVLGRYLRRRTKAAPAIIYRLYQLDGRTG